MMPARNNPRSGARGAGDAHAPRAVEIKPDHGALALFVAGKPVLPVAVDVTLETPPTLITNCVFAGVPLLRIRDIDLCWTANGKFDYRALDERLAAIFGVAGAAVALLEITVDAPDWWCEAHPEECAVFAAAADTAAVMPRVASWASARWRAEAGDALGRLVRHLRQAAWSRRCIGFQIASGEAGEWRHPGALHQPDASARMADRFRAYAVDKYRRNEGLLKQGWDDPRAAYDRIRCPAQEERRRADYGVFRSPIRSRRMLDYLECYYGEQNAAVLHFAGMAKRASEGQALVGVSYATVFDNIPTAEGGHGFPEIVLDSPDIDFIANAAPRAGAYVRALTGSLALRGKLLFHVADRNTELQGAVTAQAHEAGVIVPAATPAPTLASIMRLAVQRQREPAALRKRVSQVAVIVDPASAHFLQSTDRALWLNETLCTGQMRELASVGAPCDVYTLADLFRPDFPNYKVYVCLNLFYVTEAERRRLDARIKRTDQTAIWAWASGIADEAGIDGATCQKTIGTKLRVEMNETELRARIVEGQDPLTWGYHPGTLFGSQKAMSPTITVTDRSSVRLGANSDNKTVFAANRHEHWTAVQYGAVPVPAGLLRNALRAAGCHLYAAITGSHDFVTADSGLVALRAEGGKGVSLSLPGVTEVRDAFTGTSLGTGSDFELSLAPDAVGCYLLRPLPKQKKETT